MRAAALQEEGKGEAAEKWHEGESQGKEELVGRAEERRGFQALPDWEGQPIRNLRSI